MISATAIARDSRELLVFAAVSTATPVTELVRAFEAKHPAVKVRTSFAGTNELLRQLQSGARADLFLSADESSIVGVKALRKKVPLFSNALVVVVPASSAREKLLPSQLLSLRRVAVADPTSVPAGRYAKAWLQSQGLWSALEPTLVPVLDVKAALAAAEAGRVDAAIVYATDSAQSRKVREVHRVPDAQAPAIAYGLVQLRAGADAAALYDFFAGAEASAVFVRHGFKTN